MLILMRKPGQSIVVGEGDDKIEIFFVKHKSGHAHIGVAAPRDIPVHRREVYDQIQAAGEEAE